MNAEAKAREIVELIEESTGRMDKSAFIAAVGSITSALTQARDEALEEAAKVAEGNIPEGMYHVPKVHKARELVKAIRALMSAGAEERERLDIPESHHVECWWKFCPGDCFDRYGK